MSRWILFFFALVLLQSACTPPKEEKLTEVQLSFTDPELRKIADFQDQRLADSLISYFSSKDPTYRYAAAMAFGSSKQAEGLDSLNRLLKDEIQEVRVAAAYAIGQIGDDRMADGLIRAFERYDTTKQWAVFNGAVLEAIGKCGGEKYLKSLSTISTYQMNDTLLLEGQAWGIYRFALRDITNEEGTAKMVEFATNASYPNQVRMIGANYLYRAKDIDLTGYDAPIAVAMARDEDPRVRMTLAIALGKTKTDVALDALNNQFNIDRDYRVKCNILRALGNFDYEQANGLPLEALDHPNPHISKCAAQYFLDNGQPQLARTYWIKAKDTLNWEAQLKLYTAANRHLPDYFTTTKNSINLELQQRFRTTENNYERAATLMAMAEVGWNYRYILENAFLDSSPQVRTACMEAIHHIVYGQDFRTYFGPSYRRVRQEISTYCMQAFRNGDVGMMYYAAGIYRKPGLNFRNTVDSLGVIEQALEELELPKEIETYNEIKKTLDFFTGRKESEPLKPEYNQPIDWKVLTETEIKEVKMETSKGLIRIALLPEIAPGTVVSFIKLMQQQYFDGKTFHRVVPNFVIQGGCPRGDGFGGLDFTIRSELPYLHYDQAGKVGMASSGNDTEGTQFFITHSPTPHLDGKYTIFAEVVEGMDVVHNIGIGDTIQSVQFVE
jgi:cyclophilin family peptidyl-prolyl cis-trans isomerase/HEAT repeat protein